MAYTKTNWSDRVVQNPLTYTLQNNPDGTVTLIPAEGTIVQTGTPLTANALNNLENQYNEAINYFNNPPVTWTNLTLLNGSIVYSSGTEPQYKKIGNIVFIQGAVKGLTGALTQVATLPSGYRPSQAVSFAIPTTNNSGANFARWTINTLGAITMESISAGGSNATSAWYPMTMCFVAA
jgi:hypothetical protein